jgi:hypothetical protein
MAERMVTTSFKLHFSKTFSCLPIQLLIYRKRLQLLHNVEGAVDALNFNKLKCTLFEKNFLSAQWLPKSYFWDFLLQENRDKIILSHVMTSCFYAFKKITFYKNLAGFDLTTQNVTGREDTTRPRRVLLSTVELHFNFIFA